MISSEDLMGIYIVYLKAMVLIHQQNHWEVSGPSYYGDHLLLQRLYESDSEMLDEAAEKTVGLFGMLKNQDKLGKLLDKFQCKEKKPDQLIESSLRIEKEFIKLSKKAYDILKENGDMTLGLDDMIMANSSKAEVNIYLLQQRLGTLPKAVEPTEQKQELEQV